MIAHADSRNELSVLFPWSNVKTSLSSGSQACGALDSLESFPNLSAQVTPQTMKLEGLGKGSGIPHRDSHVHLVRNHSRGVLKQHRDHCCEH